MTEDIDWNDPAQRAGLIQRVGIDRYNELHRDALAQSVVSHVNGHAIRVVVSGRFGRLFVVGMTGTGFPTQAAAEDHARSLPPPAHA